MPTAISQEKIDLSSENRTKDLANKFLKRLKVGDIIFLYGEMGVGKTTFIKYLINAFQKKNNLKLSEITSPTFNLLNEYQINKIRINHYDLFRLKSVDEIKGLNLFDCNKNTISLIEWPQMIKEKPKDLIELFFEYEKDHEKRSLQIKGLNL